MGKSERKTQTFIPRRRWEYDITVDLNFGVNVDWILLAYGIVEWWPFFVIKIMKLRVPWRGAFLISCVLIGISSWILPREIKNKKVTLGSSRNRNAYKFQCGRESTNPLLPPVPFLIS